MAGSAFYWLGESADVVRLVTAVHIFATVGVIMWAARLGDGRHARPRLALAGAYGTLGVMFLAVGLDLIPNRYAPWLTHGLLMAVSITMTWTAWTGVRYARKIERNLEPLVRNVTAAEMEGTEETDGGP